MSHTVVAIDLGASSGRVLRGQFDGRTLRIEECGRFPNRPVHVPNDRDQDFEWDVLSLWKGIRAGLREAAQRGRVDAIGIDTWGVDYGLLDEDGRLIGNLAAYRSERTEPVIGPTHERVDPAWLYARTGIQFQPFNTLYQLVADRVRAQSSLSATMLLLPDLLGYWLTGRRVCEVTNASTTGMIDPASRSWSPEVLDALSDRFGVPVPGILPELVEPGTRLGVARLSRAELVTRDGAGTPLIAVGSHDTASAVVAVPAAVAGTSFGFISCGTWSLVGMELAAPVRSADSMRANFTNELGVDGTVRYLKNIMGMWVQQECIRQWREQHAGELDWPTLTAETEAAPPLRTIIDINAPEFLAPGDMLGRIASAAQERGEPVPTGRGQYLRAITDSLAVAYRRALREAQELSGRQIDVVHIVGGGSNNALLCQQTADATGLPVVAGPEEGTGIGNMVVQLRAIGAIDGGLPAMRAVVAASSPTRTYQPIPGATAIWDLAERRAFRARGGIPSRT